MYLYYFCVMRGAYRPVDVPYTSPIFLLRHGPLSVVNGGREPVFVGKLHLLYIQYLQSTGKCVQYGCPHPRSSRDMDGQNKDSLYLLLATG